MNSPYSFQLVGYGGSGTYIWGASGLPAGLTINSFNGSAVRNTGFPRIILVYGKHHRYRGRRNGQWHSKLR